ncbi:hypothetical protein H4S02_003049 [Coemansia sp. RSA 2611]|nr:hypothetical protein H4S02_003049 [Coemansia sp. RSA 2611]
MQTEVEHAAKFWLGYLPDSSVSGEQRERLRQELIGELGARYAGHWNAERPQQGSAYRSISNWRGLDGALAAAARRAHVAVSELEQWLPRDVIVWCDPHTVTYRTGDHGTLFTFYEDKRALLETVKRTVAEKVSRPGSDFVISAYTTPVVIRSADGVEIARRGGPAAAQGVHASPTKGAGDLRRSAMSPLRQVASFRPAVADAAPPRWSAPTS